VDGFPMPEACRRRGCRTLADYSIERLVWQAAHWHPDESTMAGVDFEQRVEAIPSGHLEAIMAELTRVAHLPEAPTEAPAHGVRWLRQRTFAELRDGV
jgi:hypothetical protein